MRVRPSGVALFLAIVAGATAARADGDGVCRAPDDAGRAAAKAAFARGVEAYRVAGYDAAIAAWREAYALDCTAHPLLVNLASAYERDGRPGEAADALELYLARRPADPDAAVLRQRIAALRAKRAPDVPAAADVHPSPPAPSGSGAGPWIVMGAGAAATIAGGALFFAGRAEVSGADAACPARVDCDPDVADRGNAGAHLRDAGIVVTSVGAAAIVGGALWRWLARAPVSTSSSARLAPDVRPQYAGVWLGASF